MFKSNKIILFIAITVIILLILALWLYQADSDNVSISRPGPTGEVCTTNTDCVGQCGTDECLVASCTIQPGNETGQCSCLGICN